MKTLSGEPAKIRGIFANPPWIILLLLLCARCLAASEAIPNPSDQAADVRIEGRSSTAIHVDVAKIGQTLPDTFAGVPLGNTPGFDWYVSRHYALKTDAGDAPAREYLELLECAWPHYARLFGQTPIGIERKRLAVVYGQSKKSLDRALKGDHLNWNFSGGGITFEQWRIAYAYPSGSLHYQQRYILIHECTHLYQMCLSGRCDNTPIWFVEGVADGLASHVYDERAKRITFDVFDKATPANFLDQGLAAMRQNPKTIREIDRDSKVSRGVGFLLVHFLRGTPERRTKFQTWCKGLLANPNRAAR